MQTDYYFKVDNYGNITATKGNIKLGAYTAEDDYGNKYTDYYFKVDDNGNLVCTKATIKGTVNATGGNISGALYIGGKDEDGSIIVKDANDKEVAKISKNGITAISGKIGGFRILKGKLDGGADDKGIWIYPPYDSANGIGDSRFPYGGVAVGTAGYGLIQVGYSINDKNTIRMEYGDHGRYIDHEGIHEF